MFCLNGSCNSVEFWLESPEDATISPFSQFDFFQFFVQKCSPENIELSFLHNNTPGISLPKYKGKEQSDCSGVSGAGCSGAFPYVLSASESELAQVPRSCRELGAIKISLRLAQLCATGQGRGKIPGHGRRVCIAGALRLLSNAKALRR